MNDLIPATTGAPPMDTVAMYCARDGKPYAGLPRSLDANRKIAKSLNAAQDKCGARVTCIIRFKEWKDRSNG